MWHLRDKLRAPDHDHRREIMQRQPGASRRSLTIAAAALAAVISLGLGANAALNKLTPAKSATSTALGQFDGVNGKSAKIALVIGNGHYPDANAPLVQPINDARALTATLRRDGFDVEVVEDAGKDDMRAAISRLKSKVKRDSVVMLFYGGYGVQAAHESYMIPVDAKIWKEADVRRDGVSIESVLADLKQLGARAKLVVVDASRRNPYERRFRTYSRGLAPIDAPDNALILSSASPDKVADDSREQNSVLVSELLSSLDARVGSAEKIFNRTRVAVSRASEGRQVPTVSSSLVEDVRLGPPSDNAGS
jgi:uncharacterized caspase-like protein